MGKASIAVVRNIEAGVDSAVEEATEAFAKSFAAEGAGALRPCHGMLAKAHKGFHNSAEDTRGKLVILLGEREQLLRRLQENESDIAEAQASINVLEVSCILSGRGA